MEGNMINVNVTNCTRMISFFLFVSRWVCFCIHLYGFLCFCRTSEKYNYIIVALTYDFALLTDVSDKHYIDNFLTNI